MNNLKSSLIGLLAIGALAALFFFFTGHPAPSVVATANGGAIAVSLSADPPAVGANVVAIQLTDPEKKVIADAKVAVAAVMPAMPSMGMPEMRSEAATVFRNGRYLSTVNLGMAGNWLLKISIDHPRLAGTLEYSLVTGSRGLTLRNSTFNAAGRPEKSDSLKIDPRQRRLIGIKTDVVKKVRLVKKIETYGKIGYDPGLFNAQNEYLQARAAASPGLLSAAKEKLVLLGMSEPQIERLAAAGTADDSLLLAKGRAWLYASVYEYEFPFVKIGQAVSATSPAAPGKIFRGAISSIDPVIDPKTRTITVRAALGNPAGALAPEMFVNVEINADLGSRLAVPRDAVLDSGTTQRVFVDLGNGYFQPRTVKLGRQAEPYVEILAGLAAGDRIVTDGNFLLDSEARLQ